ncbi:hypothetical protein LEMLEM_LOCUS12126 [Lemmus lemmus]
MVVELSFTKLKNQRFPRLPPRESNSTEVKQRPEIYTLTSCPHNLIDIWRILKIWKTPTLKIWN